MSAAKRICQSLKNWAKGYSLEEISFFKKIVILTPISFGCLLYLVGGIRKIFFESLKRYCYNKKGRICLPYFNKVCTEFNCASNGVIYIIYIFKKSLAIFDFYVIF
jgi:hypothetical protein